MKIKTTELSGPALRFSDLQTASAWLQGYDYANKELTGKSK